MWFQNHEEILEKLLTRQYFLYFGFLLHKFSHGSYFSTFNHAAEICFTFGFNNVLNFCDRLLKYI